jgi:chromosome segregation ATPase
MMAQNDAFLQEFQTNMEKLSQINGMIQKNIQDRKNMSLTVISRLGKINETIKDLSGKIITLKNLTDQLQGNVTSNTTSMAQKQTEMDALRSQIQKLTEENDNLKKAFEEYKQKCEQESLAKQQQIDNMEAQIQKLSADNQSLQDRANALTQELQNTGDIGAKSADDLKRQSDTFIAQIDQIVDENNKKIASLTSTINEKDKEISQLQQQLAQNEKTANQSEEQYKLLRDDLVLKNTELQNQITKLNDENNDLIGRLRGANAAILNALQNLDQLSNNAVDQENTQNIERSFQEVENSLIEINRAVQGQTGMQPDQQTRIVEISGTKFPLAQIITQLESFTRQNNTNVSREEKNKYNEILRVLINRNSPDDEIQRALSKMSYKDGNLSGGKKTRKNKKIKQRGGFQYKSSSSRKSLNSIISAKKSRASRSSRSSRRN